MDGYKYSIIVDTEIEYLKIDERVREKLSDIINTVDLMYCLQNINSEGRVNLENFYYSRIIKILEKTIPHVNAEGSEILRDSLQVMDNGKFDIIRIPLVTDKSRVNLLFGKIISPGNNNKKRYAAAVGTDNSDLNKEVRIYDQQFTEAYSDLPFLREGDGPDKVPQTDFSCTDVSMLAGELNRKNKPISVFFSGNKSDNPEAMSKVTLFTNIYFTRFKVISVPLGMKYINGFGTLYEKYAGVTEKVLLFWLRGHDLGHLVGEDNLGVEMKDKRFVYYVLHELKSDIISLYMLSGSGSSLSCVRDIDDGVLYNVFVAEALRYVRRGNPDLFPDTSSAYLAINYMIEVGAIYFSPEEYRFDIDPAKCNEAIVKLCEQLVEIFKTGKRTEALNFYEKYMGDTQDNFRPVIADTDMPSYIDIEYKNKI